MEEETMVVEEKMSFFKKHRKKIGKVLAIAGGGLCAAGMFKLGQASAISCINKGMDMCEKAGLVRVDIFDLQGNKMDKNRPRDLKIWESITRDYFKK